MVSTVRPRKVGWKVSRAVVRNLDDQEQSRAGWAIVIPAVVLGGWVVGSSMLARRGQVRVGGLIGGQHGAPVAGRG